MLAVDHAHAQTTTTSAVDGTTPLGLSRGAPAGAYALSGFDSVNLYNGNLNFRLPLLQIGGRGGGQTGMMLALNTKGWHVKHTVKTIAGETIESFSPSTQGCAPSDVDYGPGTLSARQSGILPIFCSFSAPSTYVRTLTRLTFGWIQVDTRTPLLSPRENGSRCKWQGVGGSAGSHDESMTSGEIAWQAGRRAQVTGRGVAEGTQLQRLGGEQLISFLPVTGQAFCRHRLSGEIFNWL